MPGATAVPSTADEIERGTLRGRPRRVVRVCLLALFRLLVRLRLEGVELVPAEGAVLVVANHVHNADPVLLCTAYPRPLHFMAKKEAFGYAIFRFFLRTSGAFPVDRGKSDRNAIRHAQARLNAGIAVGIYPEGTRSPTRSLQRAHPGAGMLALVSGAPIQPVVITGSERLPLNGKKGKLAPGESWPDAGHRGVRITFGPPFVVPREIDGRKVTADEATEIIMVELARMLPPDYRGVYADALAAETTRRALPLPR